MGLPEMRGVTSQSFAGMGNMMTKARFFNFYVNRIRDGLNYCICYKPLILFMPPFTARIGQEELQIRDADQVPSNVCSDQL